MLFLNAGPLVRIVSILIVFMYYKAEIFFKLKTISVF